MMERGSLHVGRSVFVGPFWLDRSSIRSGAASGWLPYMARGQRWSQPLDQSQVQQVDWSGNLDAALFQRSRSTRIGSERSTDAGTTQAWACVNHEKVHTSWVQVECFFVFFFSFFTVQVDGFQFKLVRAWCQIKGILSDCKPKETMFFFRNTRLRCIPLK